MEEQLERLKINKDETTVAESPPPKVTVMKSQSGACLSFTKEQIDASLAEIKAYAAKEGARFILIKDAEVDPQDHQVWSAWVLLRRVPETIQDMLELRAAVVGNVDAGKSTTLGVLTKGILDDGRGKARLEVFRHKHEVDSGRTSSIGQDVLGFDEHGHAILATPAKGSATGGMAKLSSEEICLRSDKVVTFMDLAGHEKYLKTTMFGLTGHSPDYAMLIVGANAGVIGMAREHLALAFALNVPLMVLITKVDMCPAPVLKATQQQVIKVLKSSSSRRTPITIASLDDVLFTVHNLQSQRLCPVFSVSNVSGEGIDLVRAFLHLLPINHGMYRPELPAEFQITESYSVPGVGTVVAGTMISGTITMGQTIYIGPETTGELFTSTVVRGIQRKRINVDSAVAGQSCSFALKKVRRASIRKGMVLIDKDRLQAMNKAAADPENPPQFKACFEFTAEVIILFHSTTISHRYKAMLHCGVVRQSVAIVKMIKSGGDATVSTTTATTPSTADAGAEGTDGAVATNANGIPLLRTGDRSIVRFRFIKYPEYLKVGQRLIFREGRTKGIGRIIQLH